MAAGDLTTLTDALLWLGLDSDDDDIVARLVTAISSAMQKHIGYQIASASYNRTLNGVGGRQLMLRERPITAVSSLTIDGITIPASTSPLMPGFVFDDKVIYLRGWYVFCRGAQNISIQFTAGFETVPGDIAQACLDWVKITYDNLDTLPGVSEIDAGDTKIKYGDEIAKLGKQVVLLPPIIAQKLLPYKRVAPT